MKIGIIVGAHDGLQSILTGVGVVVNSFVESFYQIRTKSVFLKNNDVELICIAPFIKKDSKDYHPKVRESTINSCKKNNGRLIEISTLSDGSSQRSIWGNPSQWRSASLSLATTIRLLEKDYDKIYLFAHDTIFSLVRYYLKDIDKVNIVWIPHSLGTVFEKGCNEERLKIEEEAINSLSKKNGDFIGYIGKSFKEVLEKDYCVNKEKLIPLINGLYLDSDRYNLSLMEKEKIINSYNIPKNKKLIFSWGRCVSQKGFDIIIPAYKKLIEKYDGYHLVLLMPIETSDKEYVSVIEKEIKDLPPGSVTPIFKFDFGLPYALLKNKNMNMILFASRFEGNPLTPLEALAFSSRSKILYSNIAPLNDILKENGGAFQFELDSNSLYHTMLKAHESKNFTHGKFKRSIIDTYSSGLSYLFHN
jgi:glycosyltransferase involved in cell wall biosynthesis